MDLRVIKLITGELIFGEVLAVPSGEGDNAHVEIQVKTPFTAVPAGVMPYLADVMGSAPGAVQIHPMNILFQLPLSEFPIAEKAYKEATSKIIAPESKIII